MLIVLTSLFLVSCSSVERITTNSLEISELANTSATAFQNISIEVQKTKDIDRDFILSESNMGYEQQIMILDKSKDIISHIPRVEDSVPWWATLVKWVFVGLSVVGVGFILWYTGIGYLIKKLCYSVGLLIPSNKKTEARMLIKAMDSNESTTTEEAIAVLRANDKAFDAAYRREKEKRK
jgi:hypothetical protein